MTNSDFNNELQHCFSYLMPYMQYFFDDEIAFTMSDTKKFLKVVNSQNINMNASPGDPLRPGGAAYECIKAKDVVSLIVAKEVFGVEIKAIGIPVKDESSKIVGSIVLVKSLKKHYEISDLSDKLASNLKIISEGSNEIAAGIENAVQSNDKIILEVKDAENNTKDTDNILSFIKSIASQTNMLGLNAAIEASHAGEQGKGFSVLAQEIRKMSSSSNKSINEINLILKKIQTSVTNISTSVITTSDSFKDQLAQIQEITSSIEDISSTALTLKELSKKV